MSLDGFLAMGHKLISWFSVVEKEGEDYGYVEFNKTADTYIVGRKTYDTVLKLTGVTFYNGDIEELINGLKSEDGKDIYCDGGGQIVKLLMEKNLIDEYRVSVIPIILGDGKRLFKGGTPMINLKTLPSKQYESGLMHLRYKKK